jgi:hypothetical protein
MFKLIQSLVFYLLILFSGNLIASQAENARTGADSLSYTLPISKFMITNEQLALRNVAGEYHISFPISDRLKPLSAILNISLTNSNALKADRSQVAVYVNDFIVGQIKLDPNNYKTEAKFLVDQEYLVHGYNKVTFKAAQHYTDTECEDWSSPELWTIIDSVKSTVTLNYQPLPVVEKLSELNALINDRLNRYSISILRGEQSVSDNYLYWGAIISQAVKLRLKYVPLELDEHYVSPYDASSNTGVAHGKFNIHPDELKNDAILIGAKEKIDRLIPNEIKNAIQGPYLGIFQQDTSKNHFILVISGNNDEEVKTAVQSFALFNNAFPDEQQTIVNKLDIPETANISPYQSIIPGNTYEFSELDFQDIFMNLSDSVSKLELHLPPDIYSTEDSNIKLNLNLAYGAAFRNDSVINISLNGVFMHAIHLKELEGAHYQNYLISLPLNSFRPGQNTLTFKYILTPSKTTQCGYVQLDNLVAKIYSNSTISIPEAGKAANLPDLDLLERTGYPLIKNASAKDTVFKLLDKSSDTILTAWQLITTLAVYEQVPVFDINITQGDIPDKANIALIGKLDKNSQSLKIFEQAPVQLTGKNQFAYTFKEHQSIQEESDMQWIERQLFGNQSPPPIVKTENKNALITQTGDLGDEYLMMSYPSQNGKGVVLALLSEANNSLHTGFSEMLSGGLWNELQGNVFIWNKNKQFHWLQEGNIITVGDGNFRLVMIKHFSDYPWQWLSIVVLLVLLVAWVTHKLLQKYQQNTH